MSESPLPIERYAQMRAEMETGRSRDEVLARAGVTAEEWLAAQRAWLDRMGKDLERGRFELANRYTQALLARQRELAALTAAPTKARAGRPAAQDRTPGANAQISTTGPIDISAIREPLPFTRPTPSTVPAVAPAARQPAPARPATPAPPAIPIEEQHAFDMPPSTLDPDSMAARPALPFVPAGSAEPAIPAADAQPATEPPSSEQADTARAGLGGPPPPRR